MYMNQYAEMRKEVQLARTAIIGMHVPHAEKYIESKGLQSRIIQVNGRACMVTADCHMDRIGLIVENGIVVDTEIG